MNGGILTLGASACLDTSYTSDKTVTEVESTIALGQEPISYGQFLVLIDDDYSHKVNLLDEHRSACKR